MTTPNQRAANARADFKRRAPALVAQLDIGCCPFEGREDLSTLALWFANEADTLVVAVGPEELSATMDKVLAWAIAWQGNRRLIVICGEGHEAKTMERLPWIDRSIEVRTYGDADLLSGPVKQLGKAESIAMARDEKDRPVRPLANHDLGSDTEALNIDRLVRWLDAEKRLARAGRKSYDAWTCLGKRALAMRGKTTSAVMITAGVDYRKTLPEGEQRSLAVTVTWGEPLSDEDFEEIKRRVTHACERRLGGDSSYLEHRMQSNLLTGLARGIGLAELGIKDARREYPAYRGKGKPGLIDFLGIDTHGRLHVVETKANPDDVAVVLQAIDYAVWVMANQTGIRSTMGPGPAWEPASSDERVVIDFVCAPKVPSGRAIGPYMGAQLRSLSPDLEWHVWLMTDALDERCELTELPRDEMTGIDGWR